MLQILLNLFALKQVNELPEFMVSITKKLTSAACKHFRDSINKLYLQNALKTVQIAFGN